MTPRAKHEAGGAPNPAARWGSTQLHGDACRNVTWQHLRTRSGAAAIPKSSNLGSFPGEKQLQSRCRADPPSAPAPPSDQCCRAVAPCS